MTPIKQILSAYPSLYAAGKVLNIHPGQLKRWLDADALVDEKGGVWIKTKGNLSKPDLK